MDYESGWLEWEVTLMCWKFLENLANYEFDSLEGLTLSSCRRIIPEIKFFEAMDIDFSKVSLVYFVGLFAFLENGPSVCDIVHS